MPNIQDFNAGPLQIRPTETGVEARAMTARRIGTFSSQLGGAEEMLARETERLSGQTSRVGAETQALGREYQQQGDYQAQLERDTGRRIGSAVTDVGDAAVKQIDHVQLAQGAQKWAQLVQDHTQAWNAIVSDPKFDANDPTVVPRFMAGLENDLQSFKNGFITENGQKHAETLVDALRLHMAEKAHADMATGAAMAVENNVRGAVNSLSNTVHSDPSSLKFSLAGLDATIEGLVSSSPTLKGVEAVKLREGLRQKAAEAIVKSAAVGYIEKTATVPPWATDPQFSKYINGAELKVLEKQAQVQAKSNLLTEKQLELYARQQADQRMHAGFNKAMIDNTTIDPQTGRPIINPKFSQDLLDVAKNNPDAPSMATTVRTGLSWIEHQQNLKDQPTRSDPTVKADLMTRIFDPTRPTTEIDIMRAEVEGKIAPHDGTIMRQMVQHTEQSGTKSEAFKDTLSAAKATLTYSMPGIPGKDPKGMESYARFVQDFMPKYQAAVRAGTLPPNALDMSDPKSMISQSIKQFKRDPKQLLTDRIEEMRGIGVNLSDETITGVQTVDAPPVPPAARREVGKVYELPKGRFKWNGSGWEKQ